MYIYTHTHTHIYIYIHIAHLLGSRDVNLGDARRHVAVLRSLERLDLRHREAANSKGVFTLVMGSVYAKRGGLHLA